MIRIILLLTLAIVLSACNGQKMGTASLSVDARPMFSAVTTTGNVPPAGSSSALTDEQFLDMWGGSERLPNVVYGSAIVDNYNEDYTAGQSYIHQIQLTGTSSGMMYESANGEFSSVNIAQFAVNVPQYRVYSCDSFNYCTYLGWTWMNVPFVFDKPVKKFAVSWENDYNLGKGYFMLRTAVSMAQDTAALIYGWNMVITDLP